MFCGGVLLDFRREGVKNSRRLLCFLGVSPALRIDGRDWVGLDNSPDAGVGIPSVIDVRFATTTDGGVLSVDKAVVDAASNGDAL